MTPKEKAKELYEKYAVMWHASTKDAKQCALICVDVRIDAYTCPPDGGVQWGEDNEEYWQEVKTEIENL